MKRIMVVLGTRPEAIKLCPVIKELNRREGLSASVCSSGQHRGVLESALHVFDVRPDFELDCMRPGQSVASLYAKILDKTHELLMRERPDMILVQGDTTTACAAAHAAFYARIPIGHVEAGLRTYHMHSPFPEELHRRTVSLMTDLHFAPTVSASKNLIKEGVDAKSIVITGNTVVDALRYTLRQLPPPAMPTLPPHKWLIVFTAHRREHLGKTMEGMLRALCRIVEEYPDVVAICPLHPNPNVRKTANAILRGRERIVCIEPPDVAVFHRLLSRSDLILTDSGGIQEEATALGIPTVVMRYSTERAEGILAGNLRLAGSGEDGIFETTSLLLQPDSPIYESMKRPSHVFGDGNASARIADALLHS